MKATFDLQELRGITIPPMRGVKHLKLKLEYDYISWPSEALVDCILWSCHPEILTMELGGKQNMFIEKGVRNNCCKSTEIKCWRHDLKEVKIEEFIGTKKGMPLAQCKIIGYRFKCSDAQFVNSGINGNISSKYKTDNLDQRLVNVKSFPHGIRNCYTLRPEQVKNIAGTPFISTLELRHLDNSIYKSQSGCMLLYERKALGAYGADGKLIGYNDELGRLWTTYSILDSQIITTIFPTDSQNSNDYKLPREIMSTAVKPLNVTQPLACYFDHGGGPTIKLYVYFHFCKQEELRDNEVREFDILLNHVPWVESVVPSYLKTTTITQEKPESGDELWITIVRTNRSTLPPILNAMEIYLFHPLFTFKILVDAMVNISLTYGVKKNWQGDPCFPMNLSWYGVNCSYIGNNSPQITLLRVNLSSSGLTWVIAPALSSLKSVLHLDLSNNSLTGPVPEFLAQLPALKIL
ncbi:putative LRR receptor-like serine/threonine-protein kinase [Camellia lanceoleosa]|uniref:LRR receptor-like serine/threonine-protein kinase n=1 Tax=Camellia lanceoleosa TaxID=1840588 RepID=A0ACC0F8H3_9ERIC|nr:putative LRR receptor-like serine/threonine-protein kinase [Camellia lanceoleosa]